MIRVGIIGYGYWGPNVARNFVGVEGADVAMISDRHLSALERAQRACPNVRTTCNDRDILCSSEIDAVAIITPISSHFEIARTALENGKHIFVEKPFTTSAGQAEELIELAEKKKLKIMVDHTFLFTGAVRKMKELIDTDVLGELFYFDSTRVNLGLLQNDANVVWDLAPHDLSIMDFLIDKRPLALSASGVAHINGQEDVAYIVVYFPDKLIAHFTINWLSPVKIRTTLIGGRKKMLVWNDMVADEKIRIYDKGVEIADKEKEYSLRINYRTGDMCAPKLEQVEALKKEAEYFIRCIDEDVTPINDGAAGLRVVKLLEAIIVSLKKNGSIVEL